jgi:hypothetical protein
MTRSLLLVLVAVVVGMGAAALGWRAYAPATSGETVAAVADAPAARNLFPKVLNR